MLRQAADAETAQDFPVAVADLDQLATLVTAMKQDSLPRCADSNHHRWRLSYAIQGAVSQVSLVQVASPLAIERSFSRIIRSRADARWVARELKDARSVASQGLN